MLKTLWYFHVAIVDYAKPSLKTIVLQRTAVEDGLSFRQERDRAVVVVVASIGGRCFVACSNPARFENFRGQPHHGEHRDLSRDPLSAANQGSGSEMPSPTGHWAGGRAGETRYGFHSGKVFPGRQVPQRTPEFAPVNATEMERLRAVRES